MKPSLPVRSAAALLTLLLLLTGCLGLRCDAACSLQGARSQRGQVHVATDHCAGMAMQHAGMRTGIACSMAKSCVPTALAPLPQLAELGPALLPRHFEAIVFVAEAQDALGIGARSTTARHLQIPPLLQAGLMRV